jgi:hypothetical protein
LLISSFRLHPLADLTRLWEALHGGKVTSGRLYTVRDALGSSVDRGPVPALVDRREPSGADELG